MNRLRMQLGIVLMLLALAPIALAGTTGEALSEVFLEFLLLGLAVVIVGTSLAIWASRRRKSTRQ